MFDQAFHAAQTGRARKDFRLRRNRHRRFPSAFDFERKHSAEHRHLSFGDFITGMGMQGPDNARAQPFDVCARNSATLAAFSQCARIRQGNVFIPRRISQQSKGEGTAPAEYWIERTR